MVLAIVLLAAAAPGRQGFDTAGAARGIHEFKSLCRREKGVLWGRSLCGPLILIDLGTGLAAAGDSTGVATLRPVGDVWVGPIPDNVPFANTAFDWHGVRWSVVILPLPPRSLPSRFAPSP